MTVFVELGDEPLTEQQMEMRTQAFISRDWPEWRRQRSIRLDDGEFNAFMAGVVEDTDINRAANAFNVELAAYRQALARLARYRLAEGRAAIIGEDAAGEPVELVPAIEPLPAEVEVPDHDPETGELIGTVLVPNPMIVRDDAERAAAQAVVDAAAEKVTQFVAGPAEAAE